MSLDRWRRPLIVGEAPTRECLRVDGRYAPLSGRSGARLARLLGLDADVDGRLALALRFDLANIYVRPTTRWSSGYARRRARALLDGRLNRTAPLVLLGRRVAAAFDLPRDVPLLAQSHYYSGAFCDVVVFPHPSGRSRWWNDPANVEAAAVVLRSLA